MNQNLWKPNDPEWVVEREREWAHIKANLDKMDPIIPRRSQKFHKKLFFQGELDPILSDSTAMMRENIKPPFDGCLTLFRMWYLPERNFNSYKEIFEEETNISSLNRCRGLMFNPFRQSMFSTEYGMFGGREELFVKIFLPGLDPEEAITKGRGLKNKFSYSLSPHATMQRCVEHTSIVLSSTNFNPFAPGQYLWDHFSYVVEHYPRKVFKNEREVGRLRICLRRILDWADRPESPRERANVVELRNTLFERFEAEEFSTPLSQYWKEEKLAYENGESYPEL